MFDKIFNKNIEKKEDPSNGLTVLLGKDDEPYVHMFVENLAQGEPEKFANMLYSLSNGLYAESLFNTLQELSKENEEIRSFVTQVTIRLLQIRDNVYKNINNENNNLPLVRPTKFMRKNNE
jgi:hypothetical protein